ncbi:MAG: hypothetical protein IT203_02240 [Fimbriimonadaceae bacterium]|nr:hypothetical protein [Fimbriimonadaceae bacterium]
MRKWLYCACLLFCFQPAAAQIKMSLQVGGKGVGTVSMSQKINPDGSKTVELKIEFHKQLTLRSQNLYDKSGMPVRKFMESIIPGGKLQKQTVATFDKLGANLVLLDGGQRKTRSIPLVETAPRANASELWFVRNQPAAGTQVKVYLFNMDTLAWDLQTIVYRGRQNLKVGKQDVSAHVVETLGERTSIAYLDERGMPWRIESGATVMQRMEDNGP